MARLFMAVLAALAAGWPIGAREAAPAPRSTVTDVLARYERGEYERAAKRLQGVSEYGEDGLLFEFYRDSPKWIAPAERLWFLTSTALMEDLHDWTFLNGAPLGPDGSFIGTWVPLETGSIQLGHLMHAEARLPGEPRFALARGIGIEYAARTIIDARRQTILAVDLLAAEMIDVTSRRGPRALRTGRSPLEGRVGRARGRDAARLDARPRRP